MKSSRIISKHETSLIALFYGYQEACIDRCVAHEENGQITDIEHNCGFSTYFSPKKSLEQLGVSPFQYKVNEDGSVDIFGELNLSKRQNSVHSLPVKINKLFGSLIANDCGLYSLINFPNEIYGNLDISSNNLENLKNFPKLVTGSITLSYNNKLQSLKGLVNTLNGDLNLVQCHLENLDELPKIINGHLNLSENFLTDLTCDSQVLGLVRASKNRLTKLNTNWKYSGLRTHEIEGLDLNDVIWGVENGWIEYPLLVNIENIKSRDEALAQLKAKAKLLKLI